MVGSGVLTWPAERPARVAMQIALCRAIAGERVRFIDFVHEYMYTGQDSEGYVHGFATKLLEPMVRDIGRLAESRVVPPVLFEAMGTLPPSGDATLDDLLNDARLQIQRSDSKVALGSHGEALGRLGKTEVAQRQRKQALVRCSPLGSVFSGTQFRELLETEAKQLTAVGNAFRIRHFETDKVAWSMPSKMTTCSTGYSHSFTFSCSAALEIGMTPNLPPEPSSVGKPSSAAQHKRLDPTTHYSRCCEALGGKKNGAYKMCRVRTSDQQVRHAVPKLRSEDSKDGSPHKDRRGLLRWSSQACSCGSARRKVHRRRRLSGLASQRLQPKLLSNAQKPSEPGLSRKPDLLGSSGVTTSLQSRWDEEPSSRRK